jgi:hypothetical protein
MKDYVRPTLEYLLLMSEVSMLRNLCYRLMIPTTKYYTVYVCVCLCMYLCVCIYIYTHTNTYIYTHTHIYIRTRECMCIQHNGTIMKGSDYHLSHSGFAHFCYCKHNTAFQRLDLFPTCSEKGFGLALYARIGIGVSRWTLPFHLRTETGRFSETFSFVRSIRQTLQTLYSSTRKTVFITTVFMSFLLYTTNSCFRYQVLHPMCNNQ